jgi:DNA-binding MarR family transcriptional regulator
VEVAILDTLSAMSAEPEQSATPDLFGELPGSERIGHLLWESAARVMLLAEPLLAELQLSLPSMGALERIAAAPGITASELARKAFKTQQAVSQVTGRLERLGYVERRIGAGRGVGLHATDLGKEVLAKGTAIEAEIDAQLQAMVGEQDAEQLRSILRRLRAGLVAVTD